MGEELPVMFPLPDKLPESRVPNWPTMCLVSWLDTTHRWYDSGASKEISHDAIAALRHAIHCNLLYIAELEAEVAEMFTCSQCERRIGPSALRDHRCPHCLCDIEYTSVPDEDPELLECEMVCEEAFLSGWQGRRLGRRRFQAMFRAAVANLQQGGVHRAKVEAAAGPFGITNREACEIAVHEGAESAAVGFLGWLALQIFMEVAVNALVNWWMKRQGWS